MQIILVIDDKKDNLVTLSQSEEKYHLLAREISDVIFEIDHQGKVFY